MNNPDSIQAIAIIPVAGIGSRMKAEIPKQYLKCAGHPIIWHSLARFQNCHWIQKIYVPLADNDPYWEELIGTQFNKVITLPGGDSRAQSVMNALDRASDDYQDNTWTFVHDAARPCLSEEDLEQLKEALLKNIEPGVILANKVHDTVKNVAENGLIQSTVDRSSLWCALTPQVFPLGLLRGALAQTEPSKITDEASAVELSGAEPFVIQGNARNIKVTRPEDLELAELYLSKLDNS